ncbi:MAG: tetratricopeptide repeat protein [Bradymonadaceae bacterium]
MRRMIGLLLPLGVLSLLIFASPALAVEDPAVVRGNKAYNESRYAEAEQAFIEAIQTSPERPEAYRNLARTYFWQDQYSAATAYYDFYIRLNPQGEDAEQIRSERRLASNRAGGEAWTMPESQRMALRALQNELDEGRAYTAGAGGAWGLYRALLRMQYAQPDLAVMRRQLLRRLVDEFEGHLIASEHQPSPILDLDDWKVQEERLAAARRISDDELVEDMLRRRELIVRAAQALLNHQFDHAVRLSAQAAEENPDMLFVNWYRITALTRSGKLEAALEVLETFARRLAQTAPHHLSYARIMRASLLRTMGREEDAAEMYVEMFWE